jgi:zinc protease
MQKISRLVLCVLSLLGHACIVQPNQSNNQIHEMLSRKLESRLHTSSLANGMRIVCYTADNTNEVTVGAWIDVGSKDEQKFGLAHILEHMMFKGTRTFGEGYIERLALAYGLSRADYNAYTSYDHTCYYFKTDSQNWKVFGNLVADLLQNLHVTDQALNSELNAILQEIKMRFDDENMFSIGDFYPHNHPYSHHLIGYKEDVLSYTSQDVMDFYKEHYIPNNVVLLVCGNVNPQEVFDYAAQAFVSFQAPASSTVKRSTQHAPFYSGLGAASKTVYHTGKSRSYSYRWQGVPDATSPESIALAYCAAILSKRLHRKWVDQQGMCFDAHASNMSLDHGGCFKVFVSPKEAFYGCSFDQLLQDEIALLIERGVTDDERDEVLLGCINDLICMLEDPSAFLRNVCGLVRFEDVRVAELKFLASQRDMTTEMIADAARLYLRPAVMHTQVVVPLPEAEQPHWLGLQQKVRAHEEELMQSRARVQPDVLVHDSAVIPEPQPFDVEPAIEHEELMTSNGIKLYFARTNVSCRSYFMLLHKNGQHWEYAKRIAGKAFAIQWWPSLLLQGNAEYSKHEFSDYCMSKGIDLFASSDALGCKSLHTNFDEGLRLLRLSLDKPLLPQEILERNKTDFMEVLSLAQNNLFYRLHEYIGRTWLYQYPDVFSVETEVAHLHGVTMDDIRAIIEEMKDPRNLVALMAADCSAQEALELVEKHFGSLVADALSEYSGVQPLPVEHSVSGHIDVAHERTLVCAFASTCYDDEYDTPALLLLRQYLFLKLWDVRQYTGAFYSADAEIRTGYIRPGAIMLCATVSPATASSIACELQKIIQNLYRDGVSQEELASLKKHYTLRRGTYIRTATTLVNYAADLITLNLPANYYEQRATLIDQVTSEQMASVINRYFNPARWSFVTVGQL